MLFPNCALCDNKAVADWAGGVLCGRHLTLAIDTDPEKWVERCWQDLQARRTFNQRKYAKPRGEGRAFRQEQELLEALCENCDAAFPSSPDFCDNTMLKDKLFLDELLSWRFKLNQNIRFF